MPLYVIIASLAVMLSIPVLWYSLAGTRVPTSTKVSRNLRSGMRGPDLRQIVLSQSPIDRAAKPFMRVLGRGARQLSPVEMVHRIERRVVLAGSTWPVDRILVLKLLLAVVGGVGGLTWVLISPSVVHLAAAILAGMCGYVLPDVVLSHRAASRQLQIRNQLADVLDQLTVCVEAGLGFDAALSRSTRSGRGALSEEIARMLQEVRAGVPRREAFDNLLARTEVPELRQFVHSLVQAETYGVPIAQLLRTQAIEQRERRRQRAEERAMKLPVKLTFPLVFCILPALFVVILGPAFIHVFNSGL